jgi:alkylated DNA repair protein (DNA oxidative demethylase)
MMLDLFDEPVLPGLRTRPDIIDRDEEAMLIERIDATDPAPFKFQGWTGKRVTTSFGWSYDFEVGRPVAAEPLPDWLLPIRDRAGQFARLDPTLLIQALLIRYDPGAGSRLGSLQRCALGAGEEMASHGLRPRSSPAPRTI